MSDTRWAPYAALGVGVAAVSWAAVLIREAEAPALVIASYRLGLVAIPLGAAAAWRRQPARAPAIGRALPALLLSGALLAGHFGFWIASLQRTSVVTSVVLVTTQPLFVAAASPLLLRERATARIWLAMAVALAGVALMAGEDVGDGPGTLAGDFYALLGGMFAAGYLMAGRWARPGVPWLTYIGTVYAVAAALLVAATLIARDPFTGYSAKTFAMMGLLALGPQLIGHSAINWSLAFLPAVIVAIGILLEPVGASALAALILDETPSALEKAGGVLVLAGVGLALRPAASRAVAEPALPAG